MEWISVKERMPDGRTHKEVLTFEKITPIDSTKQVDCILIESTKSLHKDKNGVYSDGGGEDITHWMPLPGAPQD